MDAVSLKAEAGRAALDEVHSGMKLGIGTGSTAEAFIHELAQRIGGGFSIIGVPTSERTAALCRELGIPLSTLDETPSLDLTIDGADEIDPSLGLIKGGGGALLREKIVAAASERMIVIADRAKMVDTLGRFPLPIEVNRFGLAATLNAIRKIAEASGLQGSITVRGGLENPFVTDGGHLIVDASFGLIPDSRALSRALHEIPGVVEHGLFLDMANLAIIAGPDGVKRFSPLAVQ